MSQGYARIKPITKGKLMSDKMCVYCEGIFTSDTIVCPNCDELDGLLPLGTAVDYLGLDPNDFE